VEAGAAIVVDTEVHLAVVTEGELRLLSH
jgi:hypothetical protein